jgi:hypothetical protein
MMLRTEAASAIYPVLSIQGPAEDTKTHDIDGSTILARV